VQNIIYKSDSILPWDTQSAFKMTSYNTTCEENMVFCYLKGYVNAGNLVLCSYCFTESPTGNDNIHLYLNLNPENPDKVLKIDFGYDGISCAHICGNSTDCISYHPFRADDEQGFYWCGEITIPAENIQQLYGVKLEEKELIAMNMVQTFEKGDFSVLCGDATQTDYNPVKNMEIFVILNY